MLWRSQLSVPVLRSPLLSSGTTGEQITGTGTESFPVPYFVGFVGKFFWTISRNRL
jgi:hypothetical protein